MSEKNMLKDKIWQEKFRPKNVKDVISPFTEQILKAMENPMAIQNFLFYSSVGGTGKTSMSKAIVNDLGCDALFLNASKDRSIENIRTKVKDFMIGQSFNPNVKKCIVFDEFEQQTKESLLAIKGMLESYESNCFVIATTNNLQKIPGPLQTRFKIFEFTQPQKDQIKDYLINICNVEKVEYEEDGINKVINIHYPSIRKMVNHLQDLKNQDKKVTIENIVKDNSLFDKIWNAIKKEQYPQVKKFILTKGIDCKELNDYIFDIVIDGDTTLKQELKLIPIFARNERDFNLGADKNIIFISSLPLMIKALRD